MASGGQPIILTVFGHPAPDRAPAHKAMLKEARALGAEVRDLYELYPDYVIDVESEQEALAHPDLIVLQYPMHWFTPPSLMVEWLDAVWLRGFAYGEAGASLKGRTVLAALTTGARARDFEADGVNRFAITEFLRPMEQTARRCGLRWAEPFIVHDIAVTPGKAFDRGVERWRARLETVARDARARREKDPA